MIQAFKFIICGTSETFPNLACKDASRMDPFICHSDNLLGCVYGKSVLGSAPNLRLLKQAAVETTLPSLKLQALCPRTLGHVGAELATDADGAVLLHFGNPANMSFNAKLHENETVECDQTGQQQRVKPSLMQSILVLYSNIKPGDPKQICVVMHTAGSESCQPNTQSLDNATGQPQE